MNWINLKDRPLEDDEDRLLVWTKGRIMLNERQYVDMEGAAYVFFQKGKFIKHDSSNNSNEDISHLVTHYVVITKPEDC